MRRVSRVLRPVSRFPAPGGADGEEGDPGKMDVTAIYTLTKNDELKVVLQATTDKGDITEVVDV